MKFFIEQIALNPPIASDAIALLKDLGLTDWVHDNVVARGGVRGNDVTNRARLSFNYQAQRTSDIDAPTAGGEALVIKKPLELEVLEYRDGANWMEIHPWSVSHLGMHCSEEELTAWRKKFARLGIGIAQEVDTQSHTNPAIAGKRWYKYVIFDTRTVLGVDLKFIVRKETADG